MTCSTCPPGYACSSAGTTPAQCTWGEFAAGSATSCTACTASSQEVCSLSTTETCNVVTNREFADQTANYVCHEIPRGHDLTANSLVPCAVGQHFNVANTCSDCGPNKYCPTKTANIMLTCPAGTYNTAGGQNDDCTQCEAGNRCTGGFKTACVGGYSFAGASTCETCPAGFSCAGTSVAPTPCPPGQYSAAGVDTCSSCPAGFKCTTPLANNQVACGVGTYSEAGSAACLECPPGFSCPGSSDKVACATNNYSLAGATTCTAVVAGENFDSVDLAPRACQSGYYSNSATSFVCTQCPAGSKCTLIAVSACTGTDYCPAGTSDPPGTCPSYINCATGASACTDGQYLSGSTCAACPEGQKCPLRGTPEALQTGYYSPVGYNGEFICPGGYDCTDGDSLQPCVDGQFSEEGVLTCTNCGLGLACPDKTIVDTKQIDCREVRGYYNEGTTKTECSVCEAGYMCPLATHLRTPCPDGTFSIGATTYCHRCPAGYQCPNTNSPKMELCLVGTWSAGGLKTCDICPEGFECQADWKVACDVNKWSAKGEGQCKFINAGVASVSYDGAGVAIHADCASGQYSAFGTHLCKVCPVGHRCPNPNELPIVCEPGTFQANTGQTSCDNCVANTYSLFHAAHCTDCPAGYYCASTAQLPKQCPYGTFSAGNAATCTTCTNGFLCQNGATVTNPSNSLCPAGFYCTHSGSALTTTVTVTPCAGGTFNPLRGQSLVTACTACTLGYYCPQSSIEEYLCPPGGYCPAGAAAPTPCIAGTFQPNWGESTDTCQACPAGGFYCPEFSNQPSRCPNGFFCGAGATAGTTDKCLAGTYSGANSIQSSADCKPCWKGHYCEDGAVFPTPCPVGKYNDLTGKEASTDCLDCDGSHPCPYVGLTHKDVGLFCAPGHFCPAGTAGPYDNPCAAGTYSDDITITTQGECTACPAKFACSAGTNSLTNVMQPCAAGHFCAGSNLMPTDAACPAGTYSPRTDLIADTECLDCPAGKYCVGGMAAPDGDCQAGHFCPLKTDSATASPCPNGYYVGYAGAKAQSECQICPIGQFCDVGTATPADCLAGTYSNLLGVIASTSCIPCPAGYKCPTVKTIDPVACGRGSYSAASAEVCIQCELDYYCHLEATADTDKTKCPNGFICPAGTGEIPYHISVTGAACNGEVICQDTLTTSYSCLPGYYCQDSIQTPCPAGTWQPLYGADDVADCTAIPAGHYASSASVANYYDNKCPQGYWCPESSDDPKANWCARKTFRFYEMGVSQDSCGKCPSRYFCPPQNGVPFICPRGYYCPENVEFPIPCPVGTFGPGEGLAAEEDCVICYGGRYCSQYGLAEPDGLCDKAYYCIDKSVTPVPLEETVGHNVGNHCESGGYCPRGSKYPAPCYPGFYTTQERNYEAAQCIACDAGMYCDGQPADPARDDVPSDVAKNLPPSGMSGQCAPGYYCTGQSATPYQFFTTPGHYSLIQASAEENCLVGQYQSHKAQDSCDQCIKGYYCDVIELTFPIDCTAGNFCGDNVQAVSPCDAGTYSKLTHLWNQAECWPCKAGYYCPAAGQADATDTCDQGHFCRQGATVSNPVHNSADFDDGECPAFHFCEAGVGVGTPCEPGTYETARGSTVNTDCEISVAAKYANTVVGHDAPTMTLADCGEGYFCVAGSKQPTSSTDFCIEGQKCPAGSAVATACVPGEWQPNKLQGTCYTCPAGYYCEDASATGASDGTSATGLPSMLCPVGYYCPEGTLDQNANPCPKGTFNPNLGGKALQECIPAPPGFYQDLTGADAIDPTKTCTQGYYCALGSFTATPNTATDDLTGIQWTNYGGQCRAGYYCPTGSPIEIPCTPGSLCTTVGLAAPDQDCPAGSYCSGGNAASATATCPKGYYCLLGAVSPIPCPAGKYNDQTGQDADTDCQDQQAGYYQPIVGKTLLDTSAGLKCADGFTCPAGSVHDKAVVCPIGFYCAQTSPVFPLAKACNPAAGEYQDEKGSSSCKTCPDGFVCDQFSATKCQPQEEGPSYWCKNGQKTTCEDGTYNFVDGSYLIGDCLDCPRGYYCSVDPAIAVDKYSKIVKCPAKKYCNGKTAVPIDCPIGFYCPIGTNIPIPCDQGYYCSTTLLEAPEGLCDSGSYCQQVDFTPGAAGVPATDEFCMNEDAAQCKIGSTSRTQNTCPPGKYCPIGSDFPIECPIGTYLDLTGQDEKSDCIACTQGQYCPARGQSAPLANCEPGYYCPEGSDDKFAVECPRGYYCSAGSFEPTKCAQGTYNPNMIQATCAPCQPGFYCPDEEMYIPTICPAGSYCAGLNTITPSLCPAGYFSDADGKTASTECQFCAYGKSCDTQGLVSPNQGSPCAELKYCYPNDPGQSAPYPITLANQLDCVQGQYCPSGSIIPSICPPGTFNNEAAATADKLCTNCLAEFYCPLWGLTQTDLANYPCPDGYLCLGGAIHPSNLDDVTIKLCPAGSYCAQINTPTTELKCPVNTFNPMKGQKVCQDCRPGFECPNEGMVYPDPCPRGYYCPSGVAKIPCPAGTYNSQEYATGTGSCLACPPGKYCEAGGATFTDNCKAGYVCVGGNTIADPGETDVPQTVFTFSGYLVTNSGLCPTGHFCPIGSSYPRPCKEGTYQNQVGQEECLSCPYGKYCPGLGETTSGLTCADGYVCLGGSIYSQPFDFVTGRLCKTGHYCQSGTEQKCPGGTYSSVTGLSQCDSCPPGNYCNDNEGTVEPLVCPTRKYCPKGTEEPFFCPAGTYTESFMKGLESKDQCADCPTSFYCEGGNFDRSKLCDAGYYCLSGAYAKNQADKLCPMGYFCTRGTKLPTACPDGKYSKAGAGSEDDCVDCLAGYYCVRGVSTAYLLDCPEGHYCPSGEMEPNACPKGTYNNRMNMKKLEDCRDCPRGTACDVEGISRYDNKFCPPGHYCPKDDYNPKACPAGSWRPNQGGHTEGPIPYSGTQTIAGCYICVEGFYCPKRATIIPELCPSGTYCPLQSEAPFDCPPGFYCRAGSGEPEPCPKGYYCPGSSEDYFKCPFGTYCPEASRAPIPCPDGTYGSGNEENYDVESACKACGRGLYSTVLNPNECLDCTPGYVCLGRTNSPKPLTISINNGYICPLGHYCPSGSYEPRQCPIGRYSKYTGAGSLEKCLPCKLGWYNDVPGSNGCKQCGPTSFSMGGASTCECTGNFRTFVKSIGACLCQSGYKPKDDGPNVDSAIDCELEVKQTCPIEGQDVNIYGNCVDKEELKTICISQCINGDGVLVEGTGLCQCDLINDTTEVCDTKCQATVPQNFLHADGQLTVTDPVTTRSATIDPSAIPGYYGDFQCKSTTGNPNCQAFFMGISKDGDFTYDYGTNAAIMKAAVLPDNTDRTQNRKKVEKSVTRRSLLNQRSRSLQEETSQRLYNPVICIKEGDVIFFNVESQLRQYPRYFKDSILNTNQNFDYGPFEELERLIMVQNVTVQSYSYIFKEHGIYVFENAASGTVTIIGVVSEAQTCANQVNGIGASMITKESLDQVGIKSSPKDIVPNWWFICLSFLLINALVYLMIWLFIHAYNSNAQQSALLEKEVSGANNSIYYDKIREMEEAKAIRCYGLCKGKKGKVDTENAEDMDAEDLLEKHEYKVKYSDMEDILGEFNASQAILKRQLRDKERREAKKNQEYDDNGEPIVKETDEEQLLREMADLLEFIRQNRACVGNILKEQDGGDDEFNEDAKASDEDDDAEGLAEEEKSKLSKKVTLAVQKMFDKQMEAENNFNDGIREQIGQQQEDAFNKELEKNEEMKQKLLDEYKAKINDSNLNDEEKAAMLAELHAKMANINDMIRSEEDAQNSALNDALSKRRQKKSVLKNVIENYAEKKDQEDEFYKNQLVDIKQKEHEELGQIDQFVNKLRRDWQDDLDEEMKQKRAQLIERKNKELRDAQNRIQGTADEYLLAQELAKYGDAVKQVDDDLAKEKAAQQLKMEDKLRQRRDERRREIEEKRKKKEEELNKMTVDNRTQIDNKMQQVEALLAPIRDEENRFEAVTRDIQTDSAIVKDEDGQGDHVILSDEAQKAQAELDASTDEVGVDKVMKQINNENQQKENDVEIQKERMRKNIEGCMDENERARLLKQFEDFEKNLQEELRKQNEEQSARLKGALAARRDKRKAKLDRIAAEKQEGIMDQFKNKLGNKVNGDINEGNVTDLAGRIQTGFDKNEAVQVTENYIEKKNQQELIDLMNSMFEERAAALRKYMFELMTQKQSELEMLRQEMQPQRDFLKEKLSKGLMTEAEYKAALDRLQQEEDDRTMDIEIHFSEKEGQLKEELEKVKLQTENEQKKLLKDRQYREKMMMFGELMQKMDDDEPMKQYLEKNVKDAEKELDAFQKKADREKERRMHEIEEEKEQKMNELMERQDRMFNWEDKMKKEEGKYMEAFAKQREDIMSRKLADQQKELLRDMNQKDVDGILSRHKRELLQVDSALDEEQKRQMEQMQLRLKGRNEEQAKKRALKQIQMAEIQKKKQQEQAKAKEAADRDESFMGHADGSLEKKNGKLELCIQKVGLMQKIALKQCYSRNFYVKRHLYNQEKLNKFLGRGLLEEWLPSQMGDSISQMSYLSVKTQDFHEEVKKRKTITYQDLLDHIEAAEKNYEALRANGQGVKAGYNSFGKQSVITPNAIITPKSKTKTGSESSTKFAF